MPVLKRKRIMWTKVDAETEVAKVQMPARVFGFHVALGGGVLNNGESLKDLDLYFLPLDDVNTAPEVDELVAFLETQWGPSEPISSYGTSTHYARKLKFHQPKRIDVFIVCGNADID